MVEEKKESCNVLTAKSKVLGITISLTKTQIEKVGLKQGSGGFMIFLHVSTVTMD